MYATCNLAIVKGYMPLWNVWNMNMAEANRQRLFKKQMNTLLAATWVNKGQAVI